jgi:hypothetical protein
MATNYDTVTMFKYLNKITNLTYIHEQRKIKIKFGNVSYYQSSEAFGFPPTNVIIKISKTIILPVFCTDVKLGLSP